MLWIKAADDSEKTLAAFSGNIPSFFLSKLSNINSSFAQLSEVIALSKLKY